MLPILAASLLMLCGCATVNAAPASADVSNEDIRDAILSLVTIFRDNSDKLERHEYRERQLGEQLKKALSGLDKRYRTQDALITQMAEHLKNLEAKVLQNQDRENKQIAQITNTVDSIQNTLSNVMKDIEAGAKGNQAAYTIQESSADAGIASKLDLIVETLRSDEQTKKSIKETEHMVKKLEKKLEEGSGSGSQNNDKINKEVEQYLGNILDMAQRTYQTMETLPQKRDIQDIVNGTAETFQEIREELIANDDRGTAMIIEKLEQKMASVISNQDEVIKTTSEIQSMAEGFNSGVSQSYEQLLSEVRGLSKVEQVMIQTADNVMDTKRRVEYGVHQILLEVAELVKQQGKTLNGTVNRRFDDIELTILDNQSGSLTNLTTKIETEISQVWRQIGIMYEQLTASATALDRLQVQTDAYVNGSIKTMDSMENKVGMITSRMTEVDDNLNFLLGRLSMVTSEYNQIKSGLANALDDIRESFVDAEAKLKEIGPGPRPIKADNETAKSSE